MYLQNLSTFNVQYLTRVIRCESTREQKGLESSRDKNEGLLCPVVRTGEKSLLIDPVPKSHLGREKEKEKAQIAEGMSKKSARGSRNQYERISRQYCEYGRVELPSVTIIVPCYGDIWYRCYEYCPVELSLVAIML